MKNEKITEKVLNSVVLRNFDRNFCDVSISSRRNSNRRALLEIDFTETEFRGSCKITNVIKQFEIQEKM